MDRALVIGIGVVSVAYGLAGAGFAATLAERADVGAGSPHGNAGLLPPSHSVPLVALGPDRFA